MKYKISLLYIIFLIFTYFIYGGSILFTLIFSFAMHELGHIIIIKIFMIRISSFSLNIFGGELNIEGINRNPFIDILIYIFGPFINLLLILLGYTLDIEAMIIVNKYLLIFNMLPIIPLDGFYICLNIFSINLSFYKAYYISLIISIIFSIILIIIGISINIYIITLGIYFLFLSIKGIKNKELYNKIIIERIIKNNYNLENKRINSSIKLKDILYKGRRTYFIMNDKVYTDDFFLKKHLKKS